MRRCSTDTCNFNMDEVSSMRILYGTGNSGKLMVMKRYTQGLPLEIAAPSAWGFSLPQVEETGKDPLENARIKAYAYYKAFGVPTLSCDSGLYFDNVPDTDQPGVHVRIRGGVTLDDEQMIAYYSGLARVQYIGRAFFIRLGLIRVADSIIYCGFKVARCVA